VFLDLATRLSGRRAGLALVYHRVDASQQDRDTHLVAAIGSDRFEDQLDRLRSRYRLVPASRLPEAVRTRRRGQRMPLAITFDDDLSSHVRFAMPMLVRRGMPATFFLSGASLDKPVAFWWERLQRAFEDAGVDEPELRRELSLAAPRGGSGGIRGIASEIEAMSPERREQVSRRLLRLTGADPSDGGLPRQDVGALVAAGFEIGFHTRRHHSLPPLSDEELERAMSEGRGELQELVGAELSLIAYPHGNADARVARAARDAGYRVGFTTVPESVVAGSDPMLLGRLYPSYDSVDRFELEIARMLRGKKARMRVRENESG